MQMLGKHWLGNFLLVLVGLFGCPCVEIIEKKWSFRYYEIMYYFNLIVSSGILFEVFQVDKSSAVLFEAEEELKFFL